MATFKELREKTLTPAEKKKREEIAKAIEKDQPDMPMAKKMAIATATAKKVAEGLNEYGGPKISRADYLKKGKEYHEGKDLSYTVVHARKGKVVVTAPTSYDAAQKAAKQWKLKSTAGVDAYLMKESVELEEGKMKEFHGYMKQGKKPEWIAKKMGLDLATVKELIKNESVDESVDLDEGAEVYTMKKGAYTRKVDGKEADKMKKQGWKLVAREGVDFFDLRNLLGEARKDSSADLYFDTYSAAVQHAAKQAEKKGFEIVEDDWFNQVTTGKGKPGRGKTTRHTLKLTKGGKPVRKSLSIQVYNRDTNKNTYELNFYVS